MICNKCGAVCADDAKFCNVCGAALEAPAAPQQPQPTPAPGYANAAPAAPAPAAPAVAEDPGKSMAIASLVCGILSIVCCCVTTVPNILAIVFGFVAKSKGSKSPMATVGIVLGIISIVLGIIGFIVSFSTGLFAGLMESMNTSTYYYY